MSKERTRGANLKPVLPEKKLAEFKKELTKLYKGKNIFPLTSYKKETAPEKLTETKTHYTKKWQEDLRDPQPSNLYRALFTIVDLLPIDQQYNFLLLQVNYIIDYFSKHNTSMTETAWLINELNNTLENKKYSQADIKLDILSVLSTAIPTSKDNDLHSIKTKASRLATQLKEINSNWTFPILGKNDISQLDKSSSNILLLLFLPEFNTKPDILAVASVKLCSTGNISHIKLALSLNKDIFSTNPEMIQNLIQTAKSRINIPLLELLSNIAKPAPQEFINTLDTTKFSEIEFLNFMMGCYHNDSTHYNSMVRLFNLSISKESTHDTIAKNIAHYRAIHLIEALGDSIVSMLSTSAKESLFRAVCNANRVDLAKRFESSLSQLFIHQTLPLILKNSILNDGKDLAMYLAQSFNISNLHTSEIYHSSEILDSHRALTLLNEITNIITLKKTEAEETEKATPPRKKSNASDTFTKTLKNFEQDITTKGNTQASEKAWEAATSFIKSTLVKDLEKNNQDALYQFAIEWISNIRKSLNTTTQKESVPFLLQSCVLSALACEEQQQLHIAIDYLAENTEKIMDTEKLWLTIIQKIAPSSKQLDAELAKSYKQNINFTHLPSLLTAQKIANNLISGPNPNLNAAALILAIYDFPESILANYLPTFQQYGRSELISFLSEVLPDKMQIALVINKDKQPIQVSKPLEIQKATQKQELQELETPPTGEAEQIEAQNYWIRTGLKWDQVIM